MYRREKQITIDYEKIMRTADKANLTDQEMRMFIAIAVRINEDGFCEKSNEYFCKKFGKTERTVSLWLRSLEEKDLIKCIFNSHKHKRHIYIKVAGLVKVPYRPITNVNLMTDNQYKFHKMFPDYTIDCEWPIEYDMDAMLDEVKYSWFLRNNNMKSLSSFKKHYHQIIAGAWRDPASKTKQSNFSTGRKYSDQELNQLMTPVQEVEF